MFHTCHALEVLTEVQNFVEVPTYASRCEVWIRHLFQAGMWFAESLQKTQKRPVRMDQAKLSIYITY